MWLRKWICANRCEYNWKTLGLSERGCRRSKKTSEPGSVLHSAKKPMLLVFSVLAVRTEVRRAVCSLVKGYNAGTRQMLGSLGRTSASPQVWPHQPNNSCSLHTNKCQFHTLPSMTLKCTPLSVKCFLYAIIVQRRVQPLICKTGNTMLD